MYVICVYDIETKRVAKMLKLCRKYLHWVQNSVFEGELTESQLLRLKQEAAQLLNIKRDSFIIFSSRNKKWLNKEIIGKNKGNTEPFL